MSVLQAKQTLLEFGKRINRYTEFISLCDQREIVIGRYTDEYIRQGHSL